MMTRHQQKNEYKFMLFQELFMQDISIKTIFSGDAHDSRAHGHPQHRVWHLREREGSKCTCNWKRSDTQLEDEI